MKLQLSKTVVEVTDSDETGKWARTIRNGKGISLAVLSQQMGISLSYLACLESGTRRWHEELVSRFNEAIEACSPSS